MDHMFEQFKQRVDAFPSAGATLRWPVNGRSLIRTRLICREAKQQLDSHVALKYYLFFYYALESALPSSTPTRFRDGLFGIPIFLGSFGTGPSNVASIDSMRIGSIVADRSQQAQKLAKMSLSEVQAKTARYQPSDLPPSVHPRVGALVGRARFVAQRIRMITNNTVSACGVCGNHTINAATYTYSFHAAGPLDSDDESDHEDGEDEVSSRQSTYWQLCNPCAPTVVNFPTCCSLECELVVKDELAEAVPVNLEQLNYDEDWELRKKSGLNRTLALPRSVLKRNAAVARKLRAAARSTRTRRFLSQSTFDRLRGDLIKKLNVDTTLVLAAAGVATSPSLARMRPLPGGVQWRDLNWNRALTICKSRYTEHKTKKDKKRHTNPPREETLIVDELNLPAWCRSAIDSSLSLFPIKLPESLQ